MNDGRGRESAGDTPLPRWIWLHGLRAALGRPPVWITAAAMLALLSLAPAIPAFAWFDGALAHRYEPGSLVRGLDETIRFDQRPGLEALQTSTGALGGVLALLAMLLGAFTAGGWLQVFLERTEGHSLLRFFYGGARYFFRFVRVLVWTLLTLHLLGWIVYGAPWEWLVAGKLFGLERGDVQGFESELSARRFGFVQDGIYAIGLAVVLAWGDYTRTRLAAHGTRSSTWAGVCSWTLIFAHPVRSLRPLALLWLAEAFVLLVAGALSAGIDADLGPDSTKASVLAMASIGLGALLWRTIVRGARYAACVQVTRQLVRPLTRPDPWKSAIGGPGGPRYPLEPADADEFGV